MLLTDADRKVWDNVLSRAMTDCRVLLEDATLSLQTLAEEILNVPKDTTMADYPTVMRTALIELMGISVDDSSQSKDRRKAYTAMQKFLKQVQVMAASARKSPKRQLPTKKRPREETTSTTNGSNRNTQPAQRTTAETTPSLRGMVPMPFVFAANSGITEALPHMLVPSKPNTNRKCYCKVCEEWVNSARSDVESHCRSPSHLSRPNNVAHTIPNLTAMASRYGFEASTPFFVMSPQQRPYCNLCQKPLSGSWKVIATHCQGANHRSLMKTPLVLQQQVTAGAAAAAAYTAKQQEQRQGPAVMVAQPKLLNQVAHGAATAENQANRQRHSAVAAAENPSPAVPSRAEPSDRWSRVMSGQLVFHPTDHATPPPSDAPAVLNPGKDSAATSPVRQQTPVSTAPGGSKIAQQHSASSAMVQLAHAKAPTPTTITAQADPEKNTLACTVEPRPMPVKATFNQITQAPESEVQSIRDRLTEWQPFYHIVHNMGIGVTSPVLRTNPTFPAIRTAGVWFFPLEKARAFIQRDRSYKVILHMIPRKQKPSKKRADCHLWPMGTLLQIDSKPTEIQQRKQQAHDHTEWKRPSHPLDITAAVLTARLSRLEVALTAYDAATYAIHVSVCQTWTPQVLSAGILQKRSIITFLDPPTSVAKAKDMAAKCKSLCVVDDDDADGDEANNTDTAASDQGKFVFSLLCPLTKKPIVSPVRGKHCKHWQVSV